MPLPRLWPRLRFAFDWYRSLRERRRPGRGLPGRGRRHWVVSPPLPGRSSRISLVGESRPHPRPLYRSRLALPLRRLLTKRRAEQARAQRHPSIERRARSGSRAQPRRDKFNILSPTVQSRLKCQEVKTKAKARWVGWRRRIPPPHTHTPPAVPHCSICSLSEASEKRKQSCFANSRVPPHWHLAIGPPPQHHHQACGAEFRP